MNYYVIIVSSFDSIIMSGEDKNETKKDLIEPMNFNRHFLLRTARLFATIFTKTR